MRTECYLCGTPIKHGPLCKACNKKDALGFFYPKGVNLQKFGDLDGEKL